MTSSQAALILLKSQLSVHFLYLLGSGHQFAKELRISYHVQCGSFSLDDQGLTIRLPPFRI